MRSKTSGAAQTARQPRILLVEDDGFVREVAGETLRSAGYHVLEARDAAGAREAFERFGEAVDLLLTDVVLPRKNGRELARELSLLCPGLKIVYISGYPENHVAHNRENDSMFYLPKPFSADALLQKVQAVLATSAMVKSAAYSG